MKKTNVIYPSLQEVWDWKESVYQDIKNKNYIEKKTYYQNGLNEAALLIGKILIQNDDGSYCFR